MAPNFHALIHSLFAALLFCSVFAHAEHETPVAKEGILDLSTWDFAKDPIVELRGDYEFYWLRFLNQRELQTESATYFAKVPQSWNGVLVGNDTTTGHGYATYRLNILIPPGLDDMTLKFMDFGTAGRVFIDGKMLLQMGQPGTVPKTTKPLYQPKLLNFQPKGQRIELVLHVANFNHRSGGA